MNTKKSQAQVEFISSVIASVKEQDKSAQKTAKLEVSKIAENKEIYGETISSKAAEHQKILAVAQGDIIEAVKIENMPEYVPVFFNVILQNLEYFIDPENISQKKLEAMVQANSYFEIFNKEAYSNDIFDLQSATAKGDLARRSTVRGGEGQESKLFESKERNSQIASKLNALLNKLTHENVANTTLQIRKSFHNGSLKLQDSSELHLFSNLILRYGLNVAKCRKQTAALCSYINTSIEVKNETFQSELFKLLYTEFVKALAWKTKAELDRMHLHSLYSFIAELFGVGFLAENTIKVIIMDTFKRQINEIYGPYLESVVILVDSCIKIKKEMGAVLDLEFIKNKVNEFSDKMQTDESDRIKFKWTEISQLLGEKASKPEKKDARDNEEEIEEMLREFALGVIDRNSIEKIETSEIGWFVMLNCLMGTLDKGSENMAKFIEFFKMNKGKTARKEIIRVFLLLSLIIEELEEEDPDVMKKLKRFAKVMENNGVGFVYEDFSEVHYEELCDMLVDKDYEEMLSYKEFKEGWNNYRTVRN